MLKRVSRHFLQAEFLDLDSCSKICEIPSNILK
jgi:hypothetical protein